MRKPTLALLFSLSLISSAQAQVLDILKANNNVHFQGHDPVARLVCELEVKAYPDGRPYNVVFTAKPELDAFYSLHNKVDPKKFSLVQKGVLSAEGYPDSIYEIRFNESNKGFQQYSITERGGKMRVRCENLQPTDSIKTISATDLFKANFSKTYTGKDSVGSGQCKLSFQQAASGEYSAKVEFSSPAADVAIRDVSYKVPVNGVAFARVRSGVMQEIRFDEKNMSVYEFSISSESPFSGSKVVNRCVSLKAN